jgi:heterodisulfide reductase subunit A
MAKESSVLVYGTNLGGYRAAYALCKKGHKVILLNRGSFVDEIRNQTLAQLPLDFCWMCGHFPQRLFKSLGCIQDFYNARLLEVSGQAGEFKVKFKTTPQTVNNFICTECDQCVEVCPVEVDGRKAVMVHPEIGWENIYLIDWDHCTRCRKCEEICPTGALKLDRPEEIKEEKVAAIILALEYDDPDEGELEQFGLGKSPAIVKNSEVARKSLLTNFVRESVRLPSGRMPASVAVIVTPQFNDSGAEHESYNLCVGAAYRGWKLRQILPQSDVTVYLKDYRGPGKRHHRWLKKALEAGVRVEYADRLQVTPNGQETAHLRYEKDGRPFEKSVDLAILINGQAAPRQMSEISSNFGVKADEDGFCRVREFSCSETDVDGIFAVGEFSGPKGNPEAIWEGCATLTEVVKYLGDSNFKPAPPPALRKTKGEELRVGVFICSCFGAFEKKMDLAALKAAVGALPDVAHAEIIKGCCTPPTIQETAAAIKKSGVNRVVLAACTPIQKLLKFRSAVTLAGLNPLLSEFLRLREDVVNVHRDKEKMLAKGLLLIQSAVAKVKKGMEAPTLTDRFTPRALVIGGGVSGLTAALGIAENGFPVTLVEKGEALGGNAKFLNPRQRQYVTELVSRVEHNPNIKVHKTSELQALSGYAGNFQGLLLSDGRDVPVEAGVIVLATGAREYRPKGFLYGEDPRVVTQAELQDKLSGERTGIKVAMIQCVGSRIREHPYCSRVCCTQALKNALTLRKMGAEVTMFYRDLTVFGKDHLDRKARENGVRFVRFEEDSYPEVRKNENCLEVAAADGTKAQADLVVLSTGVEPDEENNRTISEMLGLPIDQDGFFDCDVNVYPYEESMKRVFKPYEWATNCVYPVGTAHSPRAFEESLLTARDAAGRALILLGKKSLPAPNAVYIAGVKESLCMGCGLCVDACAYSARIIDEIKKVAVVRPFLCDSCGSCVAVCPNDASYLRDLMSDQTLASLDALLLG